MPHIHTKPGQHDHTASAYIVLLDTDEPRIMLHKHKKLGVYMQFGGHIELDETPWQSIRHELLEETGYDLSKLEILQPKDRIKHLTGSVLHPQAVCVNTHRFTDEHFHIDTGYAFVTTKEPTHNIAAKESTDIKLLTRQELLDLPENQTTPGVREISLYVLDTCVPNWERVSSSTFK